MLHPPTLNPYHPHPTHPPVKVYFAVNIGQVVGPILDLNFLQMEDDFNILQMEGTSFLANGR